MSKNYNWEKDPTQLGAVLSRLDQEHQQRILNDQSFRRMYFNLSHLRPGITSDSPSSVEYPGLSAIDWGRPAEYNITRMIIDAVAPTVCQQLKAVVIPIGGDYKTVRSCNDMAAAISAVFDATKYWSKLGPIAYRDGSASSLGTILWFIDGGGEIRGVNVSPLNVLYHFDEGQDPTRLYFKFALPRAGVLRMYPGKRAEIESLPEYSPPTEVGVEYPNSHGGDCVLLCVAVHRAHDGQKGKLLVAGIQSERGTASAGSVELDSSVYENDFFPSAHFRYDWDASGFGGYAGARVLEPYHRSVDSLLQKVYDGLEGSVPHLLANEADRDSIALSNTAWKKVFYTTSKPDVFLPNAVSPDVIREIQNLFDKAFLAYGMSQQAAQGTRPHGLNSAPGQREWRDIKNERLGRLIENWAQLAVDSARAVIGLAAVAYRDRKIVTKAPGTDQLKEIDWPKDLREDKYKTRFDKSSGLSETLAGRKEELGELRDRGAISEATYLRMLAVPDLKSVADTLAAPSDLASMQISKALDEGIFVMPDSLQGEGLDVLITMGSREYQRAQVSGIYPREHMECLRRLVLAAKMRKDGQVAQVTPPVPAVLPGQPAGVAPMPSAVLPPAATAAPEAMPVPGAPQL